LALLRCYGSQVTYESRHTKTLRQHGVRIKAQFFRWTEPRFSGTIVLPAMAYAGTETARLRQP